MPEIDLGPEAQAFRDELREWLEANKPESLVGADSPRGFMGGRRRRTPRS